MQWFFAQPVAREQQALTIFVPKAKRKHTIETLETSVAPTFIGLENNFGIGTCAKARAPGGEIGTQLAVVVDLAVENNPDASAGIHHRLVGVRAEIDDRQPAVAKHGGAAYSDALVVRPAMRQPPHHAADSLRVAWLSPVHHSCDSAHISVSAR